MSATSAFGAIATEGFEPYYCGGVKQRPDYVYGLEPVEVLYPKELVIIVPMDIDIVIDLREMLRCGQNLVCTRVCTRVHVCMRVCTRVRVYRWICFCLPNVFPVRPTS